MSVDSASMAKDLKKVTGNFDLLKNSLRSLGGILAATFSVGAIVSFGKASYQAYQEQLIAESKLLAALKGRKDIQERLVRQAEYLQTKTVFGDEQIIEAQVRLSTILGTNEKAIRKLIPLVQDFATAKQMGLAESAELIAKTFGSSTNALTRYGIQIEGAAGSSERLASIVEKLTKQVGGLSEAAGNVDPVIKMKNAWGDMMEELGKFVAPTVTKVSKQLTDAFRIWGSKDFTFWQKLYKSKEEILTQIEEKQLAQQLEDEKNAVEETSKVVDKLTESNKKLALSYKDLRKSIAEVSMQTMGPASLGTAAPVNAVIPSAKPPAMELQYSTQLAWQKNYDQAVEYMKMMEDISDQFSRELESMFANVAVAFGQMLGDMIVNGGKFDVSAALSGIATMMERLGELAIAAGVTTLGIKKALESLNGYAAIAAGVALVSLAQVVKSTASNIAAGGSGNIASYESQQQTQGLHVYRQLGDQDLLKIEVYGRIDNEVIRLANERAMKKHNMGY